MSKLQSILLHHTPDGFVDDTSFLGISLTIIFGDPAICRCSKLHAACKLLCDALKQARVLVSRLTAESNIEQLGEEAGSIMRVTDFDKRLQEAGLCSSSNECSL